MSIIIPRSTWGAQHGRGNPTSGAKDSVTFHHFYRPNVGVVSTAREREVMRSVEAYHARNLTPRNSRIGYQHVIFQSGRVYEGTGWRRIGAHAAGQNTRRVGVAFAIDGDSVTLTPEAIEGARQLIQEGREGRHLQQNVFATRHADFSAKSCPGRNVPQSVCDNLLLPPGDEYVVAERVLRLDSPMQRGVDVKAWQEKLGEWRAANGGSPIDADSVFGPNTAEESAAFMRDVMGVSTDDPRVGPNTLKAWDEWKKGQSMTASSFTDIQGSPFEDAIEKLADAGIVEGYTDGSFRPMAPVTRGALAVVIARLIEQK